MSIYQNIEGTNFKYIFSDPEFNEIACEKLEKAGCHFWTGNEANFDSLIEAIKTTSLINQVKLVNKLNHRWLYGYQDMDLYDMLMEFSRWQDPCFENPQELQEEFLIEVKTGDYCILDCLQETYEGIASSSDLDIVFDYLTQNYEGTFKNWYVEMQGEFAYIWSFEDLSEENVPANIYDANKAFFSNVDNQYTLENYFETVLFGYFCTVANCDKDGHTNVDSYDIIANLYIDDDDVPESVSNEVMEYFYHMKPVKTYGLN